LAIGRELVIDNNFYVYLTKILPSTSNKHILKLLYNPDYKKLVNEMCDQIN
jgi:hypothetical protein